jgi:hypothetical protein
MLSLQFLGPKNVYFWFVKPALLDQWMELGRKASSFGVQVLQCPLIHRQDHVPRFFF